MISESRMVVIGEGGKLARELHRHRLARHDDGCDEAGRRRIALVVRQRAQFVASPAPPAFTKTSMRWPGAISIVAPGSSMRASEMPSRAIGCIGVILQREVHVILVSGVNETPALHFARPHGDHRRALAVDGLESHGGFGKERFEVLDRAERIEDRFSQHHDAFARGRDLRNVGKIAFDDQRAGDAAGNLHVGSAVVVRMIPVRPLRVIGRNGDLDVVAVAGLHRTKDVVGDAARAHVQSVRVEVRRVDMMYLIDERRHRIAVGRQSVHHANAQYVTRANAQRRTGKRAFVGAQVQPVTADVPIRILQMQGRAQLAVDRAAYFRLLQRERRG